MAARFCRRSYASVRFGFPVCSGYSSSPNCPARLVVPAASAYTDIPGVTGSELRKRIEKLLGVTFTGVTLVIVAADVVVPNINNTSASHRQPRPLSVNRTISRVKRHPSIASGGTPPHFRTLARGPWSSETPSGFGVRRACGALDFPDRFMVSTSRRRIGLPVRERALAGQA